MIRERRGAYGFVYDGFEVDEWLVPAPDDWISVSMGQSIGTSSGETFIGHDEAVVALKSEREVRLVREPPAVAFVGPELLDKQSLIHPFVAPAAAVLAHWQGWIAIHAGSFARGGKAWLLVGDNARGKSSTLAAIARRGDCVLSDDLAVVRGDKVLAGPRSIDLREPHDFANAEDLGIVGERRRWRIWLEAAPVELPIGGAITLDWADQPRVEQLDLEHRASPLMKELATARTPQAVLRLMSFPTISVSRPRGALSETVALVDEAVDLINKNGRPDGAAV